MAVKLQIPMSNKSEIWLGRKKGMSLIPDNNGLIWTLSNISYMSISTISKKNKVYFLGREITTQFLSLNL